MACFCKRQSNQVNKAYSLFCSKKMEIILIIPACDKGFFGRWCTPYPPGRFGDQCGGRCSPKCCDKNCNHVKANIKQSTETKLSGLIKKWM